MSEPLSDERLAQIREYLDSDMPWDEIGWVCGDAVTLLAEVDRLRAELAAAERTAEAQSRYLEYLSVENSRLRAQLNDTVDKEE